MDSYLRIFHLKKLKGRRKDFLINKEEITKEQEKEKEKKRRRAIIKKINLSSRKNTEFKKLGRQQQLILIMELVIKEEALQWIIKKFV